MQAKLFFLVSLLPVSGIMPALGILPCSKMPEAPAKNLQDVIKFLPAAQHEILLYHSEGHPDTTIFTTGWQIDSETVQELLI